jgi:hypothetical protein
MSTYRANDMDENARALIDELRSNAARFRESVGELRTIVIGLTDAGFFDCPDWDWQWPKVPAFDVRTSASDSRHLGAEVGQAVREAYDAARDWPPPLAGWPQRFDGVGLHFLKFMLAEIDAYEARVAQRFAAAEATVSRSFGP